MKVAVLGASQNPERYANRAIHMLREYQHEVIPVNPAHREIEGLTVVAALADLPAGTVDTVTVYVQADRSSAMKSDVIELNPRRVIFNPGAENPALAEALNTVGIEVVEACTLVLLRTGQF